MSMTHDRAKDIAEAWKHEFGAHVALKAADSGHFSIEVSCEQAAAILCKRIYSKYLHPTYAELLADEDVAEADAGPATEEEV